jgi:hypothetical protein
VKLSAPNALPVGLGFSVLLASWLWLTGGFALTLFLMIVPWSLPVSVYGKLRWCGRIYFPAVGAFFLFALGCTTASTAWKPFFIEDQTFLEGVVTAAERKGIVFLLARIAFGASYWFFGERQIPAREKENSLSPLRDSRTSWL